MKPLNIAILWHQHQPYYRKGDEYILPWVRMHGVKDYFDLAEILNEFPKIKQTFNIVPSMLLQIEEYISGKCKDKIQRLTEIPANELTDENKQDILDSFFICNEQNMILPYPRYRELFEKHKNDSNINAFSEQEWLDLQVWYNLTWFGPYSRKRGSVKRFFQKERDFTEEEKLILLELQIQVLKQIVPTMNELKKLKQIEISCSPMFHPILPLLVSSEAMKEAIPDAKIPEPVFSYPVDASAQIKNGLEYFESVFGFKSRGMWPSEGSVSDPVLEMISDNGINWVATDEMIISNTLKENYFYLDKYFPRKYKTANGEIAVLFRDHSLSDAIGFTYSNWHHSDAAEDFIQKLKNIRHDIFQKFGEEGLENAIVPVILDGENCWEFYPENGVPFLKELYGKLSASDELKTVTVSEVLTEESLSFLPSIDSIRAGSWINADFNIWMGHSEHIAAWEILGKARKLVDAKQKKLSPEVYIEIMNEIYIAEGSDWFWWYGDSHFAPNKYDFDDLFRWHIERIYHLLNLPVPAEILVPINQNRKQAILIHPQSTMEISDMKELFDAGLWEKAGYFDASASMSAMHHIGEILNIVRFGFDENRLFLRFEFKENADTEFLLKIDFKGVEFHLTGNSFKMLSSAPIVPNEIYYSFDQIAVLSIPALLVINEDHLNFKISVISADVEISYPRQGYLEIK